ncbi:MAG: restriction endonuclease, partial [Clostridia bacterium]|nr:restriction endonuclease [Clostridia bacterium]
PYFPELIFAPIIILLFIVLKRIFSWMARGHQYEMEMRKEQTIESLINEYHDRPTDFEEYVADLFRFKGFEAKVTPATNDIGKDIVMHKDGKTYVVEVKLYAIHNKINREKIHKLHSAMWDSHADYAIFVTTSDYLSTAVEFAKRNNIILVNGSKLIKMIEERRQAFL